MEKRVEYLKNKNAIEINFNLTRFSKGSAFFLVSLKNCSNQKELKKWCRYFKKTESEWWDEDLENEFTETVRTAWKEIKVAERQKEKDILNKLPKSWRKYREGMKVT